VAVFNAAVKSAVEILLPNCIPAIDLVTGTYEEAATAVVK
jgi:hypothetical protein